MAGEDVLTGGEEQMVLLDPIRSVGDLSLSKRRRVEGPATQGESGVVTRLM